MAAAKLRHWSFTVILDNHEVGEVLMDDVDMRVAQAAWKSLFGRRIRFRTVERWLVEEQRKRPVPPPVYWPSRPRLKNPAANSRKLS